MKNLILFISLFCFGFMMSNAQGTYTSADYADKNDTFLISTATTLSMALLNFSSTGTNKSWDFSSLQASTQAQTRFIDPNKSGYKESFLFSCILGGGNIFTCPSQWTNIANLAIASSDTTDLQVITLANSVDFYKNSTSSLSQALKGMTVISGQTPVPLTIEYENPDVIYKFPMNYGNKDTSISNYTIDVTDFGIDFIYKQQQTRMNNVDGWGSLITPYKTFPSVLRLRTVIQPKDTTVIGGIAVPTSLTKNVIYSWFDPAYEYPVLVVKGTIGLFNIETFTEVTYIDSLRCLTPNPSFSSSPIIPYTSTSTGTAELEFSNTSENSDIFTWDFGDGETSTSHSPTHTYDSSGFYAVKLVACNSICDPLRCDSTTSYILILDSANVIAGYTATPMTPCLGDTVSFINTSLNASSYTWDFGDGGTSTDESPTHVYTDTGTFNVMLIASNNSVEDTATSQITVNASYTVHITNNDTTMNLGDTVQLVATGAGESAVYSWDFSSSLSCTFCSSPKAYPDVTTKYYVNATDLCGTSTDSVNVIISSPQGIETNDLNNLVSIYPNPNNGEFSLYVNTGSVSDLQLKIYDVKGQLILDEIYKQNTKGSVKKYNLSNYGKGIYLIQLISDKETQTTKMVVK